jgi:hypothetical protein
MRVRLQISRQSALLDTPAVAPGTIPNSLPLASKPVVAAVAPGLHAA